MTHRPTRIPAIISILLALILAACQAPSATLPPKGETESQPVRPSATPLAPPSTREVTPPPASTPTPTAVPSVQVDPARLRGVEIQFWHPFAGQTGQVVADLVSQFNRENVWGVRVTANAPGSEGVLFQQVSDALKNGQPPALVAAPSDQLRAWAAQGQVVDLNTYINSKDWGLTAAEQQDFDAAALRQDQLDGAQLGFPAQRDMRLLFYNLTWAKELGFEGWPSDTADFQRRACAAAKADGSGTGGWIVDMSALTTASWMAAFGVDWNAPDPTAFRFNNPESAQALAYLRKLFDLGCAWNSRLPDPYEYFASRQALFYAGSLEDISQQEHISAHLNSQDEWTTLPFPGPDGEQAVIASGPSYAILKTTPEQQLAAWLFIRWMSVTRNQVQMVQSSGTLPLSQSAHAALSDYASQHPHWAQALEHLRAFRYAPTLPDWWLAARVLEDAGWQLIQPTALPPAAILDQVDKTIPEVLGHQ